MDPATIIGVASFALSLFGGGNSGISKIITNQLRILAGLSKIAQQLVDISEQIAELDRKLEGVPAAVETFEQVAEIQATMLRVGDIYQILDDKIAADDEIDFRQLLDDLEEVFDEILDRLSAAEPLLAYDSPTNNLLLTVVALDSVAWAVLDNLLDPRSLWKNIKANGAKRLTNPDYDGRVSAAEARVKYLQRAKRMYDTSLGPLLRQQMACVTKMEFIYRTEPPTDDRNREYFLEHWEGRYFDEASRQVEHRYEEVILALSYAVVSRWQLFDVYEKDAPEGSMVFRREYLTRTVIFTHEKVILYWPDGSFEEELQALGMVEVPAGGDIEAAIAQLDFPEVYDQKLAEFGPGKFDDRGPEAMEARIADMEGRTPGKYTERNARNADALHGMYYKSLLSKTLKDRIADLTNVIEAYSHA